MTDQKSKATQFAELHVRGNPVVIYNVWDGGSTKAVAAAGAQAIATGDHPVGFAHGFSNDDFNEFTFDIYLTTIHEVIKRAGDLPVSIDISNGAHLDEAGLKDRINTIISAGAVGINFEDTTDDERALRSIDDQAARIAVIRAAADEAGIPLFINARSDLFAKAEFDQHESLLDEAIQRAAAYKAAGANGFFVPKLMDGGLIQRLAESIDMPLNIIRLPGAPSSKELIDAGVSRISYGPVPQMQMIEWLTGQAKKAINGEI